MPALAELDRAVDALLDTALVPATDPDVLMRRARGRVRHRRAGAVSAAALVGATVLAIALVTRGGSSPVRVGTRPASSAETTTASRASIRHVSPDRQFVATVLPDGVRLHETEIVPNALALSPHAFSHYSDGSAPRLMIWTTPLKGPRPPAAEFASMYDDLGGINRAVQIDGRPAVFVTDVPETANHPDQVFLYWFVDTRTVAVLIGINGTSSDQLERVALGLRAPSVSQPPGIYVVRDGVLTRQ